MTVSKKCPENIKRLAYWVFNMQGPNSKNLQIIGMVHQSMDRRPVDGPSVGSVDPRFVSLIFQS